MHKVKFCIKECDPVKFDKLITIKDSLVEYEDYYAVKGKYGSYDKTKGIIEESTNTIIKDFIMDKNNTVVSESFKNVWNSIVYQSDRRFVPDIQTWPAFA